MLLVNLMILEVGHVMIPTIDVQDGLAPLLPPVPKKDER